MLFNINFSFSYSPGRKCPALLLFCHFFTNAAVLSLYFNKVVMYNPVFDSCWKKKIAVSLIFTGLQRFLSLFRTIVIYSFPLLFFWIVLILLLVMN